MLDPTPRDLLLVAFAPEWDALIGHVEDAGEHRVAQRTIVTGRLRGRPVAVCETGISMVNAAMTTQLCLDRLDVRRVIVSGIAGALDPDVPVGAVLAPARWGQFLEVGFGRETPAGPVLPPLPGETDLPPFGAMMPRDVMTAAGPVRWFETDPALLAVAARVPGILTGGAGTSGSAFVDHAGYRDYLFATMAAQVIDMESAAIAQVATANGIPFLVLRAISDLAGGDAEASAFPQFMTHAAEACAGAVLGLLEALDA